MMPGHEFSRLLRDWYRQNARDLPWRNTGNPYHIWLSEVILQQTRVEQGLPYYQRFIETFPSVADLALAPSDQVMRLWQGLGYYSRARNLHAAAGQVLNEFAGEFPDTLEKIKSLKGVGDYTAAAISSFAFNLPHAVVDGNVYRVLARFAGVATPIDSVAGKKEFQALANDLLDPAHAAEHNQAMMELGATVCLPRNPLCRDCPLAGSCAAYRLKKTGDFPVKSKKTKVRTRYLNYILIHDDRHLLVKQRTGKDIWQGLYELPLIETLSAREPLNKYALAGDILALGSLSPKADRNYRHLLSHQELQASFRRMALDKLPRQLLQEYRRVSFDELGKLAFPRLLIRYFQDEDLL
jgi:A/G-specific adenine glycosylase